jgi:protein-disulfide isomerase
VTLTPATLVEFADLQCPFCAQYARDALPAVIDQWARPGRLQLDLRLLTFIGPDSLRAARPAGAAALQDRLWSFSDLLFLNQGRENSGYVTTDFLRRIAKETPGLKVNRAFAERGSSQVDAQLRPGRPTTRVSPSALTSTGLSSAIERALTAPRAPGDPP